MPIQRQHAPILEGSFENLSGSRSHGEAYAVWLPGFLVDLAVVVKAAGVETAADLDSA